MKFSKMHGLGNDFIIFENLQGNLSLDQNQITYLCDRRFGIGADGIMLVNQPQMGDMKMSFFNSDGNEVEMCGNGIRCFAKYLYDRNIVRKTPMDIETLAGIKRVYLDIHNEKVAKATVNMGAPIFESEQIPVTNGKKNALEESLLYHDSIVDYAAVSMGNPHVVIFADDLESYPIDDIGPFFENHPIFPKKTNVNFVQIIDQENIKVITWERGAGLTLACGTGTCASAVMAYHKGLIKKQVKASLPGGHLWIQLKEDVYMTGEAVLVYDGIIHI